MDSPSPPDAPDYGAAAQQQGQANVETARVQGRINNPNVITPYGSQTVTWGTPGAAGGGAPVPDPAASAWRRAQFAANPHGFMDTGADGAQFLNTTGDDPGGGAAPIMGGGYGDQATVTQTLAPAQQAMLDSQNRISQGALDTGEVALGRAQETLSKPMDLQSVQDIYDRAYKAQTARLDPQWKQNTNEQETKLRNQGLVPGGEAYDNAMRTFGQGRNDAYQQAENAAIGTMPQTYQLASAAYNQPLNTVNALRTGSQVQNPTFQQFQGSTVGQTPIMQGAQAQGQADQNIYNAQVGASNSNKAMLGSAAMAAAMMF